MIFRLDLKGFGIEGPDRRIDLVLGDCGEKILSCVQDGSNVLAAIFQAEGEEGLVSEFSCGWGDEDPDEGGLEEEC